MINEPNFNLVVDVQVDAVTGLLIFVPIDPQPVALQSGNEHKHEELPESHCGDPQVAVKKVE